MAYYTVYSHYVKCHVTATILVYNQALSMAKLTGQAFAVGLLRMWSQVLLLL